jgi:hypothetical protein
MTHLHTPGEKVKSTMIYLRDAGVKKHFRVDGDFCHDELRKIVGEEVPKANPVLMTVEREAIKDSA